MSEQDTRGPEDERLRRIEALRALSSQPPQPAGPPHEAAAPAMAGVIAPQSATRRARRRWLALGAGVLAVCIVAASVLVWLNRPRAGAQKPIPDPLGFQIVSEGFNECSLGVTTDVAWSPDGGSIATIGFRQCGGPENISSGPNGGIVPSTPNVGGALGIFSATTGKLTRTIELDAVVYAQVLPALVRSDATLLQQVQIRYDHVIWSPDGKSVAVTFSVSYPNPSTGATPSPNGTTNGTANGTANGYSMGLLLVDLRSGTVQALQQPPIEYGQSVTGSATPLQSTLWDLHADAARIVEVPQALAYQWMPDGTLQPSVPLPAAGQATPAPATGAVGNPIGGKQFTIWQSGSVSYEQDCVVSGTQQQTYNCCPVTDYLSAQFGTSAAWSPDGRYLLMPYSFELLGALGKLPNPGGKTTQGACLRGKYGASWAELPLHDAALTAVIQTLAPPPPYVNGSQAGTPTGPQAIQMSWSPDGRYMAAQFIGNGGENGGEGPNPTVLTIYDTASGKIVKTLSSAPFFADIPLNQRSGSQTVSVDTFFWSTDSHRLLARDLNSHVIVLFGPKSLGQT